MKSEAFYKKKVGERPVMANPSLLTCLKNSTLNTKFKIHLLDVSPNSKPHVLKTHPFTRFTSILFCQICLLKDGEPEFGYMFHLVAFHEGQRTVTALSYLAGGYPESANTGGFWENCLIERWIPADHHSHSIHGIPWEWYINIYI